MYRIVNFTIRLEPDSRMTTLSHTLHTVDPSATANRHIRRIFVRRRKSAEQKFGVSRHPPNFHKVIAAR